MRETQGIKKAAKFLAFFIPFQQSVVFVLCGLCHDRARDDQETVYAVTKCARLTGFTPNNFKNKMEKQFTRAIGPLALMEKRMSTERKVLKNSDERRESIINNTPAIFQIADSAIAVATKPQYEFDSLSQVHKYCGVIQQKAKKHGVDSSLAMAVMYMETTHGWYDVINPMRKTILPMNIHYSYWRKMGVTPEKLELPSYNIEYGVILLRRIQDRIELPDVAKIATLYNFLGAEKVSTYGARVAAIYREKPWLRRGCRP